MKLALLILLWGWSAWSAVEWRVENWATNAVYVHYPGTSGSLTMSPGDVAQFETGADGVVYFFGTYPGEEPNDEWADGWVQADGWIVDKTNGICVRVTTAVLSSMSVSTFRTAEDMDSDFVVAMSQGFGAGIGMFGVAWLIKILRGIGGGGAEVV